MKVININVDRDTFIKLQKGERLLDVRVNAPSHSKGDILVYNMIDGNGNKVDGASMAFLISTLVALDEFVERIGEQMTRKSPGDSDELIIITLSPVQIRV